MPSHTSNKPQRVSAVLRQTRLASCLALALSLSTGVRSSVAGDHDPERRPSSALRASKVTRSALEPSEVFANIQAWRADHARPQQPASALRGSVHVVTNCQDYGAAGSLRQTVAAAASGDIIDMRGLECDVIALDVDEHILILQHDLTLLGSIVSGLPHPSIQTTGDYSEDRPGLLVHSGTGTLAIYNLWLRYGIKYGGGGCVKSAGDVTITRSMVTDCTAFTDEDSKGGGIYAAGTVRLVDSVVSDNDAWSIFGRSMGGGVFAKAEFRSNYSTISDNRAFGGDPDTSLGYAGGIWTGGNTIVVGSTIANNRSDDSGGLLIEGTGDVTVRSSTISRNSSVFGSALSLRTSGAITIVDTTVTDNTQSSPLFDITAGLSIHGSPSAATVNNSIVSGNKHATGQSADFLVESPNIVSGNHNLIGTHDGDTPTHIHQVETPLGPLADNGGPTPTHAIGTGSWAFNQGQTSQTQDQRGMPRPVGTGDDIGAFESDALFIGRFEEPPVG